MPSMNLVVIGDKPIEYSGNHEGELHVCAMACDSDAYPEQRVIVGLTLPGNEPYGKDEDGHPLPTHAVLTVDQVDETIARLLEAKKRVLDAADCEVVDEENDGLQLLKSSLGRFGVKEGDGDLTWFDTEEAAREHLDCVGDLRQCESCEKRLPLDDMESGGDGYFCFECAEELREEARRTPALHAEPTSCSFTGKVSDCDIEDNTISCPMCGADMEEGPREGEVLGEIAEPGSVPS